MSKSVLKPPIIQDNATKIAIDELYRQVNKLLTSISANAQNYGNEALEGSVRAIYEGKDNFRIEGKTSAGWASVTAQAQGRGNLYKNSPKIDSNGRLNINNVIYGRQNLELHSGGPMTLKSRQIMNFDNNKGKYSFYFNDVTDDNFTINVGANGATTVSTTDADGSSANLSLNPDGKLIFFAEDGGADEIQCKIANNVFASFDAEDGSYSRLTMYEQGGSSSNDYMKLNVEEHGATTISTLDAAAEAAHITLDADGDVILDSATADSSTGGFKVKSSGTEIARMNHHHSKTYFHIYENGGASTDDHLLFTVGASGDSTIATKDASGTSANLTLDADGIISIDSASSQIGFGSNGTTVGAWLGSSLFFAEASGAQGDIATYGQIWVKNDTPNNLYFTDDTGQDVQITNNGSLATSGGAGKGFLNWYYYSANLASTNVYYAEKWNDEFGVSSSINTYISSDADTAAFHWPVIRASRIVPYDATVTKFWVNLEWSGSNGDVAVSLWKGISPDSSIQSSTVNTTIDLLGTINFTYSGTGSKTQHQSITSFNATSLSQGDYLFVTLKRTSGTDGSSYHVHSTVTFDYT